MIVQAWRSAIALSHRRPLQGILFRDGGVRPLIGKREAQSLEEIDQKYPPEKIFPIHIQPSPRRAALEGGTVRAQARPYLGSLPRRYLPNNATTATAWCDN